MTHRVQILSGALHSHLKQEGKTTLTSMGQRDAETCGKVVDEADFIEDFGIRRHL